MEHLHKPAAWMNCSWDEIMQCEAGRVYLLNQLDPHSRQCEPEHIFWYQGVMHSAAGYEVYSDGSLWFFNTAEDEVWESAGDFVRDSMLGAITSAGLSWDQIDSMDRELLTWYCDGYEDEAQCMISGAVPGTKYDEA